jgi:hypothetical protein
MYGQQTLYAIGIGLGIVGVLLLAWIARLLTFTRNQRGNYDPAAPKPPLWLYVGCVALLLGIVGEISPLLGNGFAWRVDPVFLSFTCAGLGMLVLYAARRRFSR